jgi:hypothetical protein
MRSLAKGSVHTRSLAKGVLLQDPVELDTRLFESFQSVLRTACMYESLRARFTVDRSRMRSYLGSTTYAMIS